MATSPLRLSRLWGLSAVAGLLIFAAVAAVVHRRADAPETAEERIAAREIPSHDPLPVAEAEREQRIAELREQIAGLFGVRTLVAEARALEKDFVNLYAKGLLEQVWEGISLQKTMNVRDQSVLLLGKLTALDLTPEEHAIAAEARATTANPEDVYRPVRLLSEVLDMRLTILESELASLEHADGTEAETTCRALAPEVTRRLRDVHQSLSSLRGIEPEILNIWEMATEYYDVANSLLGLEGRRVRDRGLIRLARLGLFDLTEEELGLVAKVEEAGVPRGMAPCHEEIYPPLRHLADHIHARLTLLQGKQAGLRLWTPDSRDFRVLVEMLPSAVQSYCDRARMAASVGEVAQAVDDLSHAIELAPREALLYALRGAYQNDVGNYEAAIADANRAIMLDGQLGYTYYVRGYAHATRHPSVAYAGFNPITSWQDQLQQAKADCTTAIAFDPNLAAAYRTRALVLVHLAEYARAIGDCDKGLAVPPTFTDLYRVRALAWAGKGNFEKALADCDAIIAQSPHSPWGYAARGNIYVQQGDYQKGVEAFTAAIRVAPFLSQHYQQRAQCYRLLGDERKAKADETTLRRLAPEFVNAWEAAPMPAPPAVEPDFVQPAPSLATAETDPD